MLRGAGKDLNDRLRVSLSVIIKPAMLMLCNIGRVIDSAGFLP